MSYTTKLNDTEGTAHDLSELNGRIIEIVVEIAKST